MENEKLEQEYAPEELSNGVKDYSATPSEKMMGDIKQLKDIGDLSQLSPEQMKELDEKVGSLVDSVLFGLSNMSLEEMRENQTLLKELADKGIEHAKEGLEKLNEKTGGKLEAPITLNETESQNIVQNEQETERTLEVTEHEETKTDENTENASNNGVSYANGTMVSNEKSVAEPSRGLAGNMKSNLVPEGPPSGSHLKQNLAERSNFGNGPVEAPNIPQMQTGEKSGIGAFMDQRYGQATERTVPDALRRRNQGREA